MNKEGKIKISYLFMSYHILALIIMMIIYTDLGIEKVSTLPWFSPTR